VVRSRTLWRFIIASDYKVYLGLHVKCPVFFILIKFGTSPQIVVKIPGVMFDGNPSSGSRAVHADRDGRTDMTKAIDAFRDNANAPKMRVYVLAAS
jgi:hypothetical protein